MHYFDHAATSFPKAPGVAAEAARFLDEDAGNAGRGGHALAQRAADALERARLALARLLGVADASRIALQSGTTAALNVALRGLLVPGDRVLLGPEAHNSVLRPLAVLARERGVVREEVAADEVLRWDLADLEARLRAGPAALVVVSHGSNVTGAVQDLPAISSLCRAAGARLLVDAAQTVGALPLDLGETPVDLLAFSGHKGLLGPTGTGGLYVAPGHELEPQVVGGTGSRSEDEEPPRELPGALEAGTPNAFAFAALGAALRWIEQQTPAALHARSAALGARLRAGVRALPGVTLHAAEGEHDLAVISFVVAGWEPQELALALDAAAGICVRAGLHCAPRAHRRLGTLPRGTVRASLGPGLGEEDVEVFLATLRELTA
ncbi:MAG: aminotransferase class V-fold PLP-dependent enzyme [Planctomycetota bacterium]